MPTEVKLQLKNPLISYDKKPVKNTDSIRDVQKLYPNFTNTQLLEKCPNMTFGVVLPPILLQVPTKDPAEKLKLFRLASKIQDKMITDKGELTLDMNQIIELYDYVGKVENYSITTIAPILICLEDLKEKLKTS